MHSCRAEPHHSTWGYRRRIHGELALLGIQVAPIHRLGDPQGRGHPSTLPQIGPRLPGPTSCAPRPTPSWPRTSSRPSGAPGSASTSSPPSSTPPAASESSAPPPTRPSPDPSDQESDHGRGGRRNHGGSGPDQSPPSPSTSPSVRAARPVWRPRTPWPPPSGIVIRGKGDGHVGPVTETASLASSMGALVLRDRCGVLA